MMNIIILGVGQVGSTLAESLIVEGNNVTVVCPEQKQLRELQNRLDIQTVIGSGSHPDILRHAGAEQADMLIAVTNNDEVNMIACQVGYTLFKIPTKIARIRSPQYWRNITLFDDGAIPINYIISPEQLVTHGVRRLIEHPGALQVLDFADGRVQLVAIRPGLNAVLINKTLASLKTYLPEIDFRIADIYRQNHSIPLSGETVIEANDEVFFLAASEHVRTIMQAFGRQDSPNRRIMIAGGGNIGFQLAKTLEDRYLMKIIERNPERAEQIAEELRRTTILLGDASDRELLMDEDIDHTDVFCALTNDDEVNIMSALLAKRSGARRVMALISRTAYIELIEGSDIDIAISPQQATISDILARVRRGIVKMYSLRRGAAEAIEIIAKGTSKTSKVIGCAISDIALPTGAVIAAVVRDNKTLIAHHDIVIAPEDHVILFLIDKKHVRDIQVLFQIS